MNAYAKFMKMMKKRDPDQSYPLPEIQLFWRLEELVARKQELAKNREGVKSGFLYSEDDLRFAPVEHFSSAATIEKAIELAKQDFLEYGINAVALVEELEKEEEAQNDTQMRFPGFDYVPSCVA